MNFRSAWTTSTNYAVNDAVTFAGSSYLALAASRNAEPDVSPQSWAVLAQAGGAGPTGAAGAAATVTTLAAGASATVTNSGSSSAAVLNFGIPQGAQGATGSGGGTGSTTSSGTFGAMYHSVSYSTLYYAVNTPNASLTETASVLTWVPTGCTATKLEVYSQQSGSIKVTLRSGAAGSLTDTALVCSPATNGSCSATGSVTIAAGSFIDFRFDSASGTAAGVWTSLQCQ
jgi:collagen type VII alpha